jgi:hypothetical protein
MCGAALDGPALVPVDNVHVTVCEDHVDWGKENVLTGGEVIILFRDGHL